MLFLSGLPTIQIHLRRTAAARRFSLRISQATGRVTLSMPPRAREAEAMAFAQAQDGWIRSNLAKLQIGPGVHVGGQVPLEGRLLRIETASGRSVRIEAESLLVPGDPDRASARVLAYLRVLARDRLVQASDHYASMIGRKVTRVTLRDTRSRWGSCTHDGSLMYSWRLIMAPPSVLRYVAAHEVAHMVEMNHSDRFWAVVEQLFPHWQAERAWLRSKGSALQGIRFEAAAHEGD